MNVFFEQKLIAEELADTLFFCTGAVPSRMKTEDGPMLSIGNKLVVSCRAFKSIWVNGYRCKSPYEAKKTIMMITA